MDNTVDEFLKHLTESELLPPDEVWSLLESFPPDKRPQDAQQLAVELVRSKRLTKFQAHAVYQGRTRLRGTKITDAGLASLKSMASLRRLFLADTAITDVGLAHLRTHAALDRLNLSGTRITDFGLTQLAGLAGLRSLDLSSTRVSDKGLLNLRGLRQLEELDWSGTRVTAAGARALQRWLPKAEITI